jgi:hypothetical protein
MGAIASVFGKIMAVIVLVAVVVSLALSAIPTVDVSVLDVLRTLLTGAV